MNDERRMVDEHREVDDIYQIERLKKEYGSRVVLNVESLAVKAGEIVAVVGPSGAGKTTLLRLLNFLEQPTTGRIIYRGQVVSDGDVPLSVRRQITTVFQHPVLLRASVQDNVAYGLRLRGWRDDHRVGTLLEQVGMASLAKAPAHRLSSGEMQRVALARALVIEPAVLLLDEPTANLDPYNVGLIEEIVRRYNRERGTTVILVTHNVFQARRLAQRTALLLDGQIVEIGEGEAFFTRPQDERTRAFVEGRMIY